MLDRVQLKSHGIRYARSLLMVFKTVNMFSAEHNAAAAPIQQSYALLNQILKECGQFTVGFVDQRILLNNILTTEKSLQPLESEFLKRGIAAITFQAGLTQGGYKRGLSVVARPAKAIEEAGGITKFIAENPLELIRVFAAGKNALRNESGDTVLDSDSESFLMAKAIADMRPAGGVMDNLERMLQSSGLQNAPFFEGGQGWGQGGGGYGAPSQPGGTGVATAMAMSNPMAASAGVGGPQGITGLVENYFDSTILDSENAPQRSYVELAKVIQEMRPEMVLSNFAPARREQLRRMPPEQMAAEVIEDSAVKWAVDRLVSAPQGTDAMIVEEEVIRVLLRSLQATQMADRLARKLAQYVKDLNVPLTTTAKIQEELEWVTVPGKKKTEHLLALKDFNRMQFRRLLEHINELIKQQEQQTATALALHYCQFLDSGKIGSDDLARLPELVRAMSGFRSQFLSQVVPKLVPALFDEATNPFVHFQIVSSLTAVMRSLASFEEFDALESVGRALEEVATRNLAKHTACCVPALQAILSRNAVERVLELSLQRKDDAKWSRQAVAMIRWTGQPAMEKVFQHLEDEQVAVHRMALIRFIAKIGPTALDVARARIRHERWYVVRNTCRLLAELKDPELLTHIAPALRHSDERVQMAAVKAIFESRLSDRGPVLAEALPHVRASVRNEVLDDLRFLRDPKTVLALERYIFGEFHGNVPATFKAVQVLAAVPGEQAESVLYQVMIDRTLELALRKVAYEAMCLLKSSSASQRLMEFSRCGDDDPLAAMARHTLAWNESL